MGTWVETPLPAAEVAVALTDAAALIRTLPERWMPGQALTVSWHAASEQAVREWATKRGLPVEVLPSRDDEPTWVVATLGLGVNPNDDGDGGSYSCAVIVEVIAEVAS